MSKRLIQLLAVSAALTCSAFAAASTVVDDGSTVSIVVRYDDLNLDSQAGVASLHARIKSAAVQVCDQVNRRDLALRDQFTHCVRSAVARSVAYVGNENLTQYHLHGRRAVQLASN